MTMDDLFTKYYTPIQRYLYTHLHDYELAEDVAQEVFIQAYKALDTLYEPAVSHWIFTIAKRKCIDTVRHRNLVSFVEINEEHKTADLPDVNRQEAIKKTWESLPEHYRVAMYLYHEQDYSIRKIAAMLHVSPSTVKMRLMRGREQFREQYQVLEEEAA